MIEPDTATVPAGDSMRFSAVAYTATDRVIRVAIRWSATGGRVWGAAESDGFHFSWYRADPGCGDRTVIATAEPGARSDTALVTVACPGQVVGSVSITPPSATIAAGTSVQLTALVADTAGNALPGYTVAWSSGAAAVATVSVEGLVTGVAAGTATITATSAGGRGASSITVTAAPPGGVVLVGAGDIADCDEEGDAATAKLLDQIPGTVFTTGDNADPSGDAADFTDCYGPTWGRHKARTRPTPGNHDDGDGYYAYFGASAGPAGLGYYSYDVGAWHVVALNSNIDTDPGSEQERWLRTDLAARPRRCTLAYWHQPLFSSGSHGGSSDVRPLFQALYDHGAEVVLVGHDHNYERFAPQTPDGTRDDARGIRQFVVGTGGKSLDGVGSLEPNSEVASDADFGVVKLTLRDGSYAWEFVPVAGGTFRDSGSATCH